MFNRFNWEYFYKDAIKPIPIDIPEPQGEPVSMHIFVDSYHSGDKFTRPSQTGVMIFINRAPILWFIKKHNSVQASTFGSKFTAIKQAVNMTQ